MTEFNEQIVPAHNPERELITEGYTDGPPKVAAGDDVPRKWEPPKSNTTPANRSHRSKPRNSDNGGA